MCLSPQQENTLFALLSIPSHVSCSAQDRVASLRSLPPPCWLPGGTWPRSLRACSGQGCGLMESEPPGAGGAQMARVGFLPGLSLGFHLTTSWCHFCLVFTSRPCVPTSCVITINTVVGRVLLTKKRSFYFLERHKLAGNGFCCPAFYLTHGSCLSVFVGVDSF